MSLSFCVVMITMNEEAAVQRQIELLREHVASDVSILIVDSSTDRTPAIARELGAEVIRQFPPRGYGEAMKLGLLEAARRFDAVVTLDCDLTYPAESVRPFVRLLEEGWHVVSGSRLLGLNRGMPPFNRAANAFFASLVRLLFRLKITDLTTGMRAFRSETLCSIAWAPLQFFPAELILRMHRAGYRIVENPIEYGFRAGEVKMRKFRDLLLLIQAILYCFFTPVRRLSARDA